MKYLNNSLKHKGQFMEYLSSWEMYAYLNNFIFANGANVVRIVWVSSDFAGKHSKQCNLGNHNNRGNQGSLRFPKPEWTRITRGNWMKGFCL
jgi:hypothetical protein